ncbi:MAG: hypothetical protein U1F05_02195 [Burkholderiales bacterium]
MSTSTARAKALAAVSEWHNINLAIHSETFAALLSLARESGLLSIELCALTHLGYVASHERDRDSARTISNAQSRLSRSNVTVSVAMTCAMLS